MTSLQISEQIYFLLLGHKIMNFIKSWPSPLFTPYSVPFIPTTMITICAIWFTDVIFDLDYFWVTGEYNKRLLYLYFFLVFFKDISKPRCLHPNSWSSLLPNTSSHSACIWVVSSLVTLKSSHRHQSLLIDFPSTFKTCPFSPSPLPPT